MRTEYQDVCVQRIGNLRNAYGLPLPSNISKFLADLSNQT